MSIHTGDSLHAALDHYPDGPAKTAAVERNFALHRQAEARRLAQWEASLAAIEPEHLHDLVAKYQTLPTLDAVRDAMRFDIHRRATPLELDAAGRVLFGFNRPGETARFIWWGCRPHRVPAHMQAELQPA